MIFGIVSAQPLESNFFPSILEGLLGRLGIAAPGVQDPPASSQGGASRAWANVVSEAIEKRENRQVELDAPPSSGMPPGLCIDSEEDFLRRRSQQVSPGFTNPAFMSLMTDSIYKIKLPGVPLEAQPFAKLGTRTPTPHDSAVGKDDPETPSLPGSMVGTSLVDKVSQESPETPITVSDTDEESEVKDPLEVDPDKDSTYLTEVNLSRSDCVLQDLESQKRTHGISEGATVSKDSVPSKKAAIKKERDVEDSEGSGPPEDLLRKTRASVYDKDSEGAQVVRKMILGLEELPTQQDIDSSPVFALRKASEAGGEAPSIIGEHWIPHLRETGHLADCPPKDFVVKDRWLPLYTRSDIAKHISGMESLLKKDRDSPLIAVILPTVGFHYDREYVILQLHAHESLNRLLLSYVTGDTDIRKQIVFCPYCGVMNENMKTTLSHAQKHLGLAYLCGGCYGKLYKRPQLMYNHLQTCKAILNTKKEIESQ